MGKTKNKRMLMLVLAGAVLGWATAPTFAAEKIVLRLGHNGNVQHMMQIGMEKFKEVVEAESNGAVEVQIFPNRQLGDDRQTAQMVKLGTLDGSGMGFSSAATFAQDIELFNFPFIFRDTEHFFKVVNGPVGERIARVIEDNLDCIVLAFNYAGTRNLWNGQRPVKVADDLKGLKIRTMSSPLMVNTWNSFGSQATPMSFGEVYSALQQGVIDGAETGMVDLLVEKFYEVTKYVSYTRHLVSGSITIFSKKSFNKLPPHIQVIVLKAGQAGAQAFREDQATKSKVAFGKLKKLGLKFYEVDTQSFVDKIKDLYEKNAGKVGGMEAINQVREQ